MTEQSAAEWAASLSTADVEQMLHAELAAGRMEGVDSCLRLMVTKDPNRAQLLYDTLRVGVAICRDERVAPTEER